VSTKRETSAFLVAGLAAGLLAGCGDPLSPPWLIDQPRVIGARVEAAGEPARAWPRPGERATVRWVVGAPAGAPSMRWALAACLPGAGAGAGCAAPLAAAEGDASPELSFEVPALERLGSATQLVVAGVFCAGGAPSLTMGEPACAGEGALPTVVTLPVPLALGPESNRSPDLSGAAVVLGGAPWALPAAEACASLPQIAAGGPARSIGITLFGQREVYQSAANAEQIPRPRRESIQLSHFATAGTLPRRFSFIDAADERDPATLDVDWTPPPAAEVPPAGLVVRFYFVARDLRGGLDWQSRSLCVTTTTTPQ
jgi:hypothetical protein